MSRVLAGVVLALTAAAPALACTFEARALPPTTVRVAVGGGRFEAYSVSGVPAKVELRGDGARLGVRAPIDFVAVASLDDVSVFAQHALRLADGRLELPGGARLDARARNGGVAFDVWLGGVTVRDVPVACDDLGADAPPTAALATAAAVSVLEVRTLTAGAHVLLSTPDDDHPLALEAAGASPPVDVLALQAKMAHIRMRAGGGVLDGWVAAAELGPARPRSGGWGRGRGGMLCPRPPLAFSPAVHATIDAGTEVRIGAPDGPRFGAVSVGDDFEVSVLGDVARIHRAPHLEGACSAEAAHHRLDSLFVAASSVHIEPPPGTARAYTGRLPWTRAFLAGLRDVRTLARLDTGVAVHWLAVTSAGRLDCAVVDDGTRCDLVGPARPRTPVATPPWALELDRLRAADPGFADEICVVGGGPAFGCHDGAFGDATPGRYLGRRDPTGEWRLTPKIADGDPDTRLADVRALTRSPDGREELLEVTLETRAGTRWSVRARRLYYVRLDADAVALDSLPVGYHESFTRNDVFAASSGVVRRELTVRARSVRSVMLRAGVTQLGDLRYFCTAEELRSPDTAEASDTCSARKLQEVADTMGSWKVEDGRFVRARE